MSNVAGSDLIATELLQELKAENERKAKQIRNYHIIFALCIVSLIAVISFFLLFMNQFELSEESHTVSNVQGVYALIDSSGNIIADDLTPEQIEGVLSGNCK